MSTRSNKQRSSVGAVSVPAARRPRARVLLSRAVTVGVVGALAVAAAGCGSGSPTVKTPAASGVHQAPGLRATPSGSSAKVAVQSVAELRSEYLAIVTPADAASARFSNGFASVSPLTSRAEVAALANPETAAITKVASSLEELIPKAPPAIATAIEHTVIADNQVFQGLNDLLGSWGSRGFALSGWANAFASASDEANTTGNVLRTALGLQPLHA